MRNLAFRGPHWYVCTVAGIALLCLGWTAYRRAEEESLLRTHSGLMRLLVAGDFEQAYRLTTDEYQSEHTVGEFQSDFRHYQGNNSVPHVSHSSTVLSLGPFSAEVYTGEVRSLFEFLNGPSFFYRKERGQWRFTGETALYLD